MANLFAYSILLIWPLISIIIFKRVNTVYAGFIVLMVGYLLLPTNVAIDFPLVPPLDKESISAISVLFGYIYIRRMKISLIPKYGVERWLFIMMLVTPFITTIDNHEPIFNGERIIPGLSLYDGLSAVISQYIELIAFLLGLQLIKSHDDQLKIFQVVVIAVLWYSIPILFEIRMSPQLHKWIYGFFQHESFNQMRRQGGFRATVFLKHGIHVASFIAIGIGFSVLLWKEKIKTYNFSALAIVIYFIILLILSKTLGALVLGVFLLISIGFFSYKKIIFSALVIAFIIIFYPLLNIFEYFPNELILDLAGEIDSERADSLAYRFNNEERLLGHGYQKLFFGWGGWGRSRFFDTVTDGYWISIFGQYGLIGFLSFFGLGVISILRALKASKLLSASKAEQFTLTGYALIVSIILVEQLLNHTLYSWGWFLIGGLLGRANSIIDKNNKARYVDNNF